MCRRSTRTAGSATRTAPTRSRCRGCRWRTFEAGCHLHYAVIQQQQWYEKFRTQSFEPDRWSCGVPVELPKKCWKRACSTLPPESIADYFARWIAVPPDELQRHVAAGVLETDGTLERVLRERAG